MSTDWHVARNSCAGTVAHSTRLPQQRRQRRGTATAFDSFLALWNQGVLCLASLSQGALHFPAASSHRRAPDGRDQRGAPLDTQAHEKGLTAQKHVLPLPGFQVQAVAWLECSVAARGQAL